MNQFFASAATKQVEQAKARVSLGLQLIAPSLRPGLKKDRSIVDGLFTMWATVLDGDTTEFITIKDGEKIRLKLWSDSIRVSLPEGYEDLQSFEEALRARLFYAEMSGIVEELEYVSTDKRDGSQSTHKQIKVTSLRLMAELAKNEVIEDGDFSEDTPF